jgi:ribosomal protein L11 methyltransferase
MNTTFELIITCNHNELSPIKRFLNHLVREDFVESLRDIELGSSETRTLISLFDESKQKLLMIQSNLKERFQSNTEIREYSSELWKEAWEENYRGFESFFFKFTTHEESSPTTIFIEPLGAFGQGDHATTKATILLLERSLEKASIGEKSFLDVGCGTGIFAIWAAKFGFSHVVATDIEDSAIHATIKNRSLNQVTFEVYQDPTPPPGPFDVIVSNILPPALNLLLPLFKSRLTKNGRLFIAGFNEANISDIEKDWVKFGFNQMSSHHERGWIAVELGLSSI